MTVLTLNIHYKGVTGRAVPTVVKTICFKILARILCLNVGERRRRRVHLDQMDYVGDMFSNITKSVDGLSVISGTRLYTLKTPATFQFNARDVLFKPHCKPVIYAKVVVVF